MAKPSRGASRFAAGKKKAKKRYESQPASSASPAVVAEEPTQEAPAAPVQRSSSGPALQFRPREAAVARSAATRGGSAAKAVLQTVDYGYVYTDLKIIGGLATLLFGGLAVLSFVIH